jgi:hypothetical protein
MHGPKLLHGDLYRLQQLIGCHGHEGDVQLRICRFNYSGFAFVVLCDSNTVSFQVTVPGGTPDLRTTGVSRRSISSKEHQTVTYWL